MPRPKTPHSRQSAVRAFASTSQTTRAATLESARLQPAAATEGPEVGTALRRLRTQRELSLDALSSASGVSRAMLSQIELGRSAPTITVLWKIARALEVPFSALLETEETSDFVVQRVNRSRVLSSVDGTFSTRALFPLDRPRNVEFYELKLAPKGLEEADAHAPGTTENLVVTGGTLEITLGQNKTLLEPGDSLFFNADKPHQYRNLGKTQVTAYLVITYSAAR